VITRLYDNPGLSRRLTISAVVLVAAALYGLWELWAAATTANDATTGYLFGIAFVGGGAYGLYQVFAEARDAVVSFAFDPATGRSLTTLWRPLAPRRLAASRDDLTAWRFHIKVGRRDVRTYYLYADHAAHPRPLQFELRPGMTIADDLRRLAPEAIDEFERATGSRTN
jgi:hypothetical protein